MSLKWLLILAAVGASAYAVGQAEPPVAAAATTSAGDSITMASVSFGARLQYSVGSVGSAIVGGSVQRSVLDNKQTLADLSKAVRAAKGSDGVRVREIVRKINYMDSLAIDNLYQGRPIKAMKQSMEAKSLLNAVRRNRNQGV
jgi:hypothetical protein